MRIKINPNRHVNNIDINVDMQRYLDVTLYCMSAYNNVGPLFNIKRSADHNTFTTAFIQCLNFNLLLMLRK